MNRPIKFRGKGKKDGKWYFGNLYDEDTHGRTHICTIHEGCLNIDPNTVGQFTGLRDMNDAEIYEGDFVLIYGYLLCKVVYERSAFVYYELYNTTSSIGISDFCLGECGAYHYVEVVGNIYDDYINELIEKLE